MYMFEKKSNLKLKNEKWTKINVHFLILISRFEKMFNFFTQTIMLLFGFLSLKICYDNFLKYFMKKV